MVSQITQCGLAFPSVKLTRFGGPEDLPYGRSFSSNSVLVEADFVVVPAVDERATFGPAEAGSGGVLPRKLNLLLTEA